MTTVTVASIADLDSAIAAANSLSGGAETIAFAGDIAAVHGIFNVGRLRIGSYAGDGGERDVRK